MLMTDENNVILPKVRFNQVLNERKVLYNLIKDIERYNNRKRTMEIMLICYGAIAALGHIDTESDVPHDNNTG